MPVPAPTLPRANSPGSAASSRRDDVRRRDRSRLDVVEQRVVALGHDGQRNVVAASDGGMMFDHPADDAVRGAPDVERIGQHDRFFEIARLVDPMRSRHLAVAVEGKEGGRDLVIPGIGIGQNGGRARADVAAFDFCQMCDPNAADVGDRVQGTRREESKVKG